MKSTVFATSILALTVGILPFSASAADILGNKSDPTSAVYQEAPSAGWSGPWIGVVGGYGIFNTELDYTKDHVGETTTTNIAHLNIDGLGAEGLFGEVQVGYDHQVANNVILGAFAGANLSNAEFSASYDHIYLGKTELTSDYEWGGVIGARLGLVKGANTLFYVAGGYAYAELGDPELNGKAIEGVKGPELHGWFGEVGMEHRLSQSISLTVAGRYTDYGSETLWESDNAYCPEEVEIDVDNLTAMVGIKAKLNGLGF
jgi:outer membrane immunogenic protein